MRLIKGDKLKCLKQINNLLEKPLFLKDNIYDVLDVDDRTITLNHILYGNEYGEFDIDFIKENFEIYK